ncbi:hypothetical protein SteCoe_29185 [Stentor coeruleus]|uniref:Uncharacterized protein n=1 Tax=Stentor coeruleus TaxID=5963 RepID=A0A1R2B6K5_9CILI|nr:hypothetical protein SteCoe_29185 [Stentor coeruleus]
MTNLLLLQYDKDHAEYIQSKDTQTLILMLRRISHSSKISQEFRSQPILRLLIDSAEELMLNSFEVAVFSTFLERFGWKEVSMSPHFLMIYVGLCVKKYMGGYTNHIQEYFNKKIRNFEENYRRWEERVKFNLDVSLVDINEAYKKLSSEDSENIVNYNFYVDEILQISPPYQIEVKDSSREPEYAAREHDIITRQRLNSSESIDEIIKSEFKDMNLSQKQEEIYEKVTSACQEYFLETKTQELPMSKDHGKKNKNSFLFYMGRI